MVFDAVGGQFHERLLERGTKHAQFVYPDALLEGDVAVALVEVGPVAFLAPAEMTEQDVTSTSDPPVAYLESKQQVDALPAGIAVRMLDGDGDLAERADRHESGLTESDLAEIEDLTVVDDETLVVSVSAPPELWDRLSLDTVVESLRSAS